MKAIVSVFDEKTYTCKDTIIDTQGTHPMTGEEKVKCLNEDCLNEAGTPFTSYWCKEHDDQRQATVRENLEEPTQ